MAKALPLPSNVRKDGERWVRDCPECGVAISHLRRNYCINASASGKTCKSCSNKKPENNSHKGFYKGVLRASFVHKYKTSAEARRIDWDLDFDYLADLLVEQNFKCALSGLEISAMKVNNNASLDRVDSMLGYVEGNVQWVTAEINMMKQTYSQERFIELCALVTQTNKVKW